ncbi:hypothetical protein BMF94_3824 [Rhodotorula taiwanensis]|uniref:DDH domain-containing protein n=1 Tax=Rhodotorula taiwanensis TaxID=741276 RepID=A0A2S5B8T4_9BASI|nr:hypothetical protein BMF94_3824 [Rhodotorula taiwanensis]
MLGRARLSVQTQLKNFSLLSTAMAPKRASSPDAAASSPPAKKPRTAATTNRSHSPPASLPRDKAGYGEWKDWPAPEEQMETAREWIRECVEGKHRVVLCPDKDADGLSSACLLAHTFRALSHPRDLLEVYHLPRSTNNIFAPAARDGILATFADQGGPTRCVVLDQGSRPGEALVPGVDTLIIDHHLSDSFPEGATVLSACHSLPVATTSLLVYELSSTLVPALRGSGPTGLAALIGAYGDLGAGKLKFGSDDEPWPASLAPVEKKLTKSALSKSVALLNAPRRTPEFRVQDAYSALVAAAERAEVAEQTGGGGAGVSSAALKGILDDDRLQEAKERTSAETARWQGAPPVFTKDGKIAVVTVDSGYQIHPVIATRWTGTLRKAKTLVCVMCANTGYTPGYVHFSCRAPRKPEAPPPDLIAFLKSLAPACEALAPGWVDRVGQDWARGHREATGGIVKKEEFDVLMQAVELGVKKPKEEGGASKSPSKVNGKKVIDPGQKNTLDGFFKIGAVAKGGDEKGAVKKEGSSKVESVPARLEYTKPGEIVVE